MTMLTSPLCLAVFAIAAGLLLWNKVMRRGVILPLVSLFLASLGLFLGFVAQAPLEELGLALTALLGLCLWRGRGEEA